MKLSPSRVLGMAGLSLLMTTGSAQALSQPPCKVVLPTVIQLSTLAQHYRQLAMQLAPSQRQKILSLKHHANDLRGRAITIQNTCDVQKINSVPHQHFVYADDLAK